MPRRRHHRFAKDGSSRAYVNGQGNAKDRGLSESGQRMEQESRLGPQQRSWGYSNSMGGGRLGGEWLRNNLAGAVGRGRSCT